MGPLGDVTAAHQLLGAAEHAQQGVVHLQDVAVEVGDADAYRGALEDRAEACLGGVQRVGHDALGLEGSACDGLLLGQRPFAQRVREPGGHGVLQARRAGAQGLLGPVAAAVEHQVGVDAVECAAERLGFGAVRVDERGTDGLALGRLERPGPQRLAEPPGERHQALLELRPGQRCRGRRENGPAPDRREPAQSVLRPVRLGGHALRPTPAKPE